MASLPNQHSGFEKTHSRFEKMCSGFKNLHSGFDNPHSGFDNPPSGFENPHSGFENPYSGFENPYSGFGEKLHSGFDENLWIVTAVEIMVKMKNLCRLKDGLGPCLEDAYDKQHLPLHNKL
jgi:hypothetical protein